MYIVVVAGAKDSFIRIFRSDVDFTSMSFSLSCLSRLSASQNLFCRRSLHISRVALSASDKKFEKALFPDKNVRYDEPYDEDPLPYLSRPLGVRERPSTEKKTVKEKMEEYMDYDKVIDDRRHL